MKKLTSPLLIAFCVFSLNSFAQSSKTAPSLQPEWNLVTDIKADGSEIIKLLFTEKKDIIGTAVIHETYGLKIMPFVKSKEKNTFEIQIPKGFGKISKVIVYQNSGSLLVKELNNSEFANLNK